MITLVKLLLILSFTGVMSLADDVPTIHQIYETAKSGDLSKAHGMVEIVLKAHPQSAKAHFIDAEILVRQGNLSGAKSELAEAERLSPGLSFAKPQSVQHLKQSIAGNDQNTLINTIASQASHPSAKPFPWMMLIMAVGAIVLFVLIFKSIFSRKNNIGEGYPAAQANYSGYPGTQSSPQQSGGGLGSSMMSGLATGAAAGVGIVAGEALMHHFMDNTGSANNVPSQSNTIQPNDDSDFGMTDSSSWDDDSLSDSDNSW